MPIIILILFRLNAKHTVAQWLWPVQYHGSQTKPLQLAMSIYVRIHGEATEMDSLEGIHVPILGEKRSQ